MSTTYTIRRPGCTCWADGIRGLLRACREWHRAEAMAPGHLLLRVRGGESVEVDPRTGTVYEEAGR